MMLYELLSGSMLTLAGVAALLFFRAYRRLGDRLFLFFGIAFVMLALERVFLGLTERPEVNEPIAFIPRIVAFGIIVVAIVDRNRR